MTTGHLNYQSFAQRYAATIENHPTRLYYERPALFSLLPDVAGKRVLDAGCGSGAYSAALLEQGAVVTAFDLMADFVEMTRQRTQGQAQVFQANLADPLHFALDASFDVVISSLVLHYIPDWAAVFAEIERVLAPGGVFIFSTMHPLTDAPHLRYFETALYEMIWQNFGEPYPVMQVYHRPMMAILNPLIAAGLHLDQLLEPEPQPAMQPLAPDEYAMLQKQPIFLFARAVK